MLWKDGQLVTSKKLQWRAIAWYCHYLRHPVWLAEITIETCTKNTLGSVMCRSDWSVYNKRQRWLFNRLYVSDNDQPGIKLVPNCQTTSLWKFIYAWSDRKTKRVGRTNSKTQEAIGQTKEAYFDKSSLMISKLVNICWFSRYPCCKYVIYNIRSWKQIKAPLWRPMWCTV